MGRAGESAGNAFKQISAGPYHTCGVTVDGNVDCWGYNPHGETADRSGGNWLEVSAGEDHTCALRSDGVVDCWGDNYERPRDGPDRAIYAHQRRRLS